MAVQSSDCRQPGSIHSSLNIIDFYTGNRGAEERGLGLDPNCKWKHKVSADTVMMQL